MAMAVSRSNVWFSLFCGILLISSVSRAADWPGFRGANGDGVSTDQSVPTIWDDSKNLKWKLKMPGPGFSSPIVVGRFVFVTCYSAQWYRSCHEVPSVEAARLSAPLGGWGNKRT